ncbi:hypothetical protein CK503_09285 [Aliifodinibius salipaludis]|uniref:Uncharacterized protein n=1 Tax=Fodinibius salipaludis TaxID=2032627 RepID=A0A2A2GAJ0_9BACT|nr:hypothetical protein [Aliifodinibius salipaludis]PAU93855.1 hypothetical protein CK503_09285 [Aliifodinibius salipaludis]
MSKKKSLGSSPIAFKSKKSTMGFIPDRGVSDNKKDTDTAVVTTKQDRDEKEKDRGKNTTSKNEEKTKKKIVSYYLEIDLIDKVKSMADNNDMYYSALVTSALKDWMAKKN